MKGDSIGPNDDRIPLERTGPFVPPITFPFFYPNAGFVVTDALRKEIERAGLAGFEFRPVLKVRIVRVDWQLWDSTSDEPEEWPESGEPEDYLAERPHSPELAERMGELWMVNILAKAKVNRVPKVHRKGASLTERLEDVDIYLRSDTIPDADLFSAETVLHIYASELAQDFFRRTVPDFVSFRRTLSC